jgi:hypothetical protein
MSQHAKYAVAVTVLAACILLAIYAWSQLYLAARDRWQGRAERKARNARRAAVLAALPPGFDYPAKHVAHEGATEAYGAELRAAGQALPSADLRTTGEQMVADHHELAGISDGLDQFSERVMHELRLFLRDDAEYARVARWAPSSTTETGEFPVVRESVGAGAR